MSYTALYRKWRPDSFEEVKGQEHIVQTLRNEVVHNRIGHAYLFCGTRGTGKTTIAKLFAKTVNCEHPVNGSPCGECASCQAIARGNSFNVIEIDAASNNGVDNIRQITEAVQYAPSQGKYLVYIIDEVHMLSSGAFNALLKTLEEPPEYVIFILATTEARKVPVTIMSRCQRYDFRRISIETITGRLADLMEREGVSATDEALRYVARAADGSMRDALSILDQCISFNLGEELTFEKVLKTIGAVDVDVFVRLTEQMAADDVNGMMDTVSTVVWQGRDLTQFVSDYIWFIRNMLFLKISPETRDGMDITEETAERLAKLGESFSTDALMRYLDILGELAQEIRLSTIKRITLEMALIRMVRPQMQTDNAALLGRVEQLESRMDRVGDEVKRQLDKIPAGAFSGNAAGGVSGGMAGGSSEGQGPSDDASDARLYGGAKVPTRDELLRMTDEEKAVLRRSYTVPSQELLDKIAADWGREAADLPQPYSEFARKLKVRSAKGWLVIDNDWTEYADSRINVNFFVRNLKQITDAISDKYGRTIVFNVRHKPVDESYFRSSKASFKTKAKIDFPVENN
ncbi:MAG: DNA polymerase III subunit gamma/tau [Eubacterium sp.]|nr:DNA polymerase III subunit gamma/tau [Eubacterium sp.]